MSDFMTLRRAASELGICHRTLRDLIKAGAGPVAVRVGRWVRVRRSDLHDYILSRTIAPNG